MMSYICVCLTESKMYNRTSSHKATLVKEQSIYSDVRK